MGHFSDCPRGYHRIRIPAWLTDFAVGDVVNAACSDWAHDNPMTVTAIDRDELVCVGQSGQEYREIIEAWEIVDPEHHPRTSVVWMDGFERDAPNHD